MPVTIDGTNGITNGGGYTGDGVSFADATPANTLVTTTGGNVGIGTATPGAKSETWGGSLGITAGNTLDLTYVGGSTYNTSRLVTRLVRTSNGSDWTTAALRLQAVVDVDNQAYIDMIPAGGTYGMAFGTGTGGTPSERMRIDSAGNLFLGTSAFAFYTSKSTIAWDSLNQQGMVLKSTSTTYNGNPIIFLNQSNGVCGIISQSATNVGYGTSSDARLKENITDADDAASVVDAIKVRQFDWKETGEHQRYGFVAQELLEVAPETVIAPTNSDLPMSVDYSKLVPMLVKEIQSLRARLAAVEGAIA